jgi:hypothetical protein
VREDGHELAMMVREAMIQSGEQHRTFFIDLSKHSMRLYAQGDAVQPDQDSNAKLFQDSGSASTNTDQAIMDATTQSTVDKQQTLDDPNKLQIPDPSKANGWMDVPDAGQEWAFEPGQLCPADKVRIVRGDAYLEMDFAALTGAIDEEKSYFP